MTEEKTVRPFVTQFWLYVEELGEIAPFAGLTIMASSEGEARHLINQLCKPEVAATTEIL